MKTRYIALDRKSRLQSNPIGGFFIYAGRSRNFRIDEVTFKILTLCNGQRTIEQSIDEYMRHNRNRGSDEIVGAMAELSKLFLAGLLICGDEALDHASEIPIQDICFFPTGLAIELTDSCNLRCSYCYRGAGIGDNTSVDSEQLLEKLRAMNSRGLQAIELTGGEPFLHKDIDRILEFACGTFDLVGILTNGTIHQERILNQLKEHNERVVFSISLDDYNPAGHDKRRGKRGAFAETCKTIRALSDLEFTTRVSMTVDSHNYGNVERTLEFAKSLGAKSFAYAPVLPIGRANKMIGALKSEDIEAYLRVQHQLEEKHSDFLHLLPENALESVCSPGGCGAGHRNYALDPKGNVRPCVTYGVDQAVIGSIFNEPLDGVFSSELVRQFASLTPPDTEQCGECKSFGFCAGCHLRGLLAASYNPDACHWLKQEQVMKWLSSTGINKNAQHL